MGTTVAICSQPIHLIEFIQSEKIELVSKLLKEPSFEFEQKFDRLGIFMVVSELQTFQLFYSRLRFSIARRCQCF